MRRVLLALPFLLTSLAGSPVHAQMLPVTTGSEEARARFELGRHAAFHYDDVQALEHLDAAIAADSGFVLALLHRGGMSTRFERGPYFEAARAHGHRVTEGERRMIEAFHAFLWEGDVPRAVEVFTGLAEEYPDDPYLPTYLGLRYYRNLQRYDDATTQFQRALRRDPSFAQAHKWLGYVALDQERHDVAEAHFRRYLESAPDQPRPYEVLGQYYLRTGRFQEAAEQFERSIAVDPRFADGRAALVGLRLLEANRRLREAVGRRDAAGVAASYTPGALLMPPGGGVRSGADLEAHWRERFDQGISDVRFETSSVFVGDVGYITTELGRYQLVAGEVVADEGTYMVLWARTSDGWKRFRDMWASDRDAGER
jgi:tetratricopeptide (TPR) repeat protein